MKRHISIFALLLSAFAVVGPAMATVKVACLEQVTLTYGTASWKLTVSAAGNEGWYNTLPDNSPLTAPANPPSDAVGRYRVEWFTLPADVTIDDTAGTASKISNCTKSIAKGNTITAAEMGTANRSAYAYYSNDPLIALKYIRQYTISTAVSPDGAGTVTGGATVDAGGSVTLKATAKAGWEFVKWSEDGATDNPRTITGVAADATYTAQFRAKGYSVSSQKENAKITVAGTGKYNEDLKISWEPEGAAGYDYTLFDSVKVLAGTTELAKYTTGTSATFNMKDDCGQYYSSVEIVVKYTKTGQKRDLKLVLNEGIETIGYKIGNADAWTVVTADTTVKVPVGTQWQAYATPKDGYVYTATTAEKPYVGTMGANGATFSPTYEDLDGYRLTVNPNGGFFRGSQEKFTFNLRLREGFTNLNEIGIVTFTNGSSLVEFRDEEGEPVYDNLGHNLAGTYWTKIYPTGTFRGKGNLTVKAIPGVPVPQFTISTSVYPEGTGNAEGAGHYNQGSNIVLKATANTGYSFWHWTKDDEELSTDREYPITVTANADYVAVFTGNVYKVVFYDKLSWTPQNVFVTFGSNWPETPKPKWDGYDFLGWFTDPEEGQKVEVQGRVSAKPPSPLYAHWGEKTTATVTFVDPIGIHSATGEYDKNKEIGAAPEETQGKDWQHFDDGYWQDPNDKWYPPLTTIVTGDMTVKAKWLSVADVLDCPDSGLVFTTEGKWEVRFGEPPDSAQGVSWMQLDEDPGSSHITTSISEPGTLTFHYKGNNMQVKLSGGVTRAVTLPAATCWTNFPVVIETAVTPVKVDFTCSQTGFKPASLDWVTWKSGVLPTYHKVTFKDPSGTFTNETQSVKDGESAIAPNWETNKFELLAWDADFSNVVSNFDVNAVWTCRVEFVDLEAGNTPVTNRTEWGGSVSSPTFTPPAGKNFGGWDPAVPEAIESNMTCVAVWTAKPVYTVSYVYEQTTNKVAKTEGDTINLAGATFMREGYTQKAWSSSVDGSSRDYEFNDPYSADADLVLYPYWEKDAVVDPIAEALDCPDSGLTFTAAGGWSVFTNAVFAKVGDSCMSNSTEGATLTTTLKGPGTLSFWWCANAQSGVGKVVLNVMVDGRNVTSLSVSKNRQEWTAITNKIEATDGEVNLAFNCLTMRGTPVSCAIDGLVWTPDQTHPEPVDGEDNVTISSAAVSDGKFTLSFKSDAKFDYNLLTNANLLIKEGWGKMGETKEGTGETITFEPKIIEGQPQLFYKVETIQKE